MNKWVVITTQSYISTCHKKDYIRWSRIPFFKKLCSTPVTTQMMHNKSKEHQTVNEHWIRHSTRKQEPVHYCTWEKFTITGRICATQSWGSNNFPRAAQPSTANSRTESCSVMNKNTKLVGNLYITTISRILTQN